MVSCTVLEQTSAVYIINGRASTDGGICSNRVNIDFKKRQCSMSLSSNVLCHMEIKTLISRIRTSIVVSHLIIRNSPCHVAYFDSLVNRIHVPH